VVIYSGDETVHLPGEYVELFLGAQAVALVPELAADGLELLLELLLVVLVALEVLLERRDQHRNELGVGHRQIALLVHHHRLG
jgi:hypothetical protein